MTTPRPAADDDGRRDSTAELRRRRAAGRDPGADLVPDAAGGDPIPWEEPPGDRTAAVDPAKEG